jgi:hypothetical protein
MYFTSRWTPGALANCRPRPQVPRCGLRQIGTRYLAGEDWDKQLGQAGDSVRARDGTYCRDWHGRDGELETSGPAKPRARGSAKGGQGRLCKTKSVEPGVGTHTQTERETSCLLLIPHQARPSPLTTTLLPFFFFFCACCHTRWLFRAGWQFRRTCVSACLGCGRKG